MSDVTKSIRAFYQQNQLKLVPFTVMTKVTIVNTMTVLFTLHLAVEIVIFGKMTISDQHLLQPTA